MSRIRIVFYVAFAVLTLGACGDCAKGFEKGYREGYCREFPKSYMKACNDACVKKGAAAADCETHCSAALSKEPQYAPKCLQDE